MYLYPLVVLVKLVSRICLSLQLHVTVTLYHLAHMRLKGYSSQMSIEFLLNPICKN